MKKYNRKKGDKGESIAEKFLVKNGFDILEKNWQTRFGEIDIIAQKDKFIHFVEVKLKIGDEFGAPEEMINSRKIKQVENTAKSFLLKNKTFGNHLPQIDVVAIVLNEGGEVKRLDHYENVSMDFM